MENLILETTRKSLQKAGFQKLQDMLPSHTPQMHPSLQVQLRTEPASSSLGYNQKPEAKVWEFGCMQHIITFNI
eukprot:670856-Pelagomonas_calceolata.AAC.1